ncbi:MAG: ATP-binding protein [Actinomycetota bacterium]
MTISRDAGHEIPSAPHLRLGEGMRVAVASGKGGTGKTTVAVGVAISSALAGIPVEYLDCDVEEPNGHLLLRPRIESSRSVGILVPVLDEDLCTGCGKCAEVCEYQAIALLKAPLVFTELCHGCGGCVLACPTGALREEEHAIGVVETGWAGDVRFVQGRLNVGEELSPVLIRAVKKTAGHGSLTILDGPPGASCPAVAAVRDADLILLVAEPTPFGLSDLETAAAAFRGLGSHMALVINRSDSGTPELRRFCEDQGLEVLLEIPDDRRIAEAGSRGEVPVETLPELRDGLEQLRRRLHDFVEETHAHAPDQAVATRAGAGP